ncbi:DEAD/DEAH box helicase [Burkholderia diffusa]|uniref:DEAD/DEAH box helicase n=1 Tax=Burkholderia diffusa TaxID=488732 RepID=UPI00075C81B1|nr:DEAD/DEAH box helicase family protein [Burkholderia diffusa]KVH51554.1 type III restriction endonuclease subunit R [Burkholderia diffusa]
MKFTLKDYQSEAVREVLVNLKKARARWHAEEERNAFSLSAVTGAGKTVMAAAVFEALFHGNDDYDFDADPGAVILWFSDDPALNEQTRFRLMEASDRIDPSDLKVVEHNNFNRATFEAKKIYFLNTQKFGKNSLLVRGFDQEELEAKAGDLLPETRPDLRAYTLWDTIRNTIEDPSLTVYFVLDEAHRGMGNPTVSAQNARTTIVRRIINGASGVPGMPIVWGISATVERFDQAIKASNEHNKLRNVVVDSAKVQDSGLLKDVIILDIPDEAGDFDTVLVRRAAVKLKESTEDWAAYAKQQNDPHVVTPLMVLQIPNTPDPKLIGQALQTIFQEWPELRTDCVANVLGEHRTERFGDYTVPYISPEQVQDHTWIRVLIAKDAISTGWDCPRAEVMISFRPATDRTHITQLLGRMVRSPLARRIPGNERLNSVFCLLPHFDKNTAESVVDTLMKGGDDETQASFVRVLVNPREMEPDPNVPDSVWEKFESLPSQTRPQKSAKPAKRLTALAHQLAVDEFLPGAGKKAHAAMHEVLDAAQEKFKQDIIARRKSVVMVNGTTLQVNLQSKKKSLDEFHEAADMAVIDDFFRRAARVFSPPIAHSYAQFLAEKTADPNDPDSLLDALDEARTDIAALGLVSNVQSFFDAAADKQAKAWLGEYRAAIKTLSDDRQESYRQIREMSTEPQDVDLVRPESKAEMTQERLGDTTKNLDMYKSHLLCDKDGNYPAKLNDWEQAVLDKERKRSGFKFWYRNPQQPSQSSLGIAYLNDGEYRIVRPDFIFFGILGDGAVVADLVDPHGTQYSDALPKLRGLAQYAATHPTVFRRIESVAQVNEKWRVLDLTREDVRQAIATTTLSATALFESEIADDYS